MKISCDCKDTLALDEITEFQGGLKARSPEEVGKIIKSLKKYGFAFPLFVWKEGAGHNWYGDRKQTTVENGKPITSGCLE